MNKHERRACAAFIRKHVYNVLTFRRSDTEETVMTVKLPPVWVAGGAELSHRVQGDFQVMMDRSMQRFKFPVHIVSGLGLISIPLHRGFTVSPTATRFITQRSDLVMTQRFCVKTDTCMFPIADDIETLYEFARQFRKFVGFDTVLVSRGPVLYAALKNKITFARQSGSKLVIDSVNTRSGQTIGDIFDSLRKRYE